MFGRDAVAVTDRQPFGEYDWVGSAVLADDETFYVAYSGGLIAEFTDSLWWGSSWTQDRTFASGFESIGDLAINAQGMLYVADRVGGVIWRTEGWRRTLVVCATASGEYRFAPAGAAAVSSVMLRVRGAAPLSPTTVAARSLAPGALTITWNPPAFDGASPITSYTISVERPTGRHPRTEERHRLHGQGQRHNAQRHQRTSDRHGVGGVTSAASTRRSARRIARFIALRPSR